jgi:O-antigen ligase
MKQLVTLALVSFYMLALILDRAAGVIYGVLVLFGVLAIAFRWTVAGKTFWQTTKHYWPLNLAMAAPLIAVIAHLISAGHFSARSTDSPSRLALYALIFWAVSLVPLKYLKHVQWAFVAGALLSTIKMYVLTNGGKERYGTDFIPIIIFAEMALLLGVFSAFSIAWNGHREKLAVLLKLVAACAVMYAVYISQSRGPWLTILVFGGVAFVAAKDLRRINKIFISAIAFALLIAALGSYFHSGSIVQQRVAAAQNDIQEYIEGKNADTSLGIRFQLWRGSWILFKENPVFGVGVQKYPLALQDLAKRKIISPTAATFPHSHNDILFMMAKLGLFGLIAILAVYFVPITYFANDLRHSDREIRSVASMGMALCLGIMTLGLTDVVFLWWEIFPFYSISIALFLAYITRRKSYLSERADDEAPFQVEKEIVLRKSGAAIPTQAAAS